MFVIKRVPIIDKDIQNKFLPCDCCHSWEVVELIPLDKKDTINRKDKQFQLVHFSDCDVAAN